MIEDAGRGGVRSRWRVGGCSRAKPFDDVADVAEAGALWVASPGDAVLDAA
jgi:hypothetical protein